MTKLPWEPGFVPAAANNDLIGAITGAITQAEQQAIQIGSEITGNAAATVTQAAADAAKAAAAGAEQVVEGAVNAPAPSAPVNTPIGGDLLSQVEKAALDAAKTAGSAVLPGIEKAIEARVAAKVQAEAAEIIKNLQGGASLPDAPSIDDFTKADARSRAFRTLGIGLVLSALWGIVNILGNIATVDWADKNALPQVVAMASTSIISSVLAYVGRIVNEPKHVTAATIIPGPSKVVG